MNLNATKRFWKITVPIALFAAACFGQAPPGSTYSENVTSVTSATILGSTHALGCGWFGITMNYSGGAPVDTSAYSYTVNSSTYDVLLTWTSSFTGSITLRGCYPASGAYGSFAAAPQGVYPNGYGEPWYILNVCGDCTTSMYAIKDVAGYNFLGTKPYNIYATYGGSCNDALWVWLDPNTQGVVFGTTYNCNSYTLGNGGTWEYGITGFPSGVGQIATATFNATTGWIDVTNY